MTIAIDIPCSTSASMLKRPSGRSSIVVTTRETDPHQLIRKSAEYALRLLKFSIPPSQQLRIKIDSKIPTAVGLKSSSAVSVGVTKAIFGLFGKESKSGRILRSSCWASKDSGASLTGAYDDAAASLLGGVAFADNLKFRLLKHTEWPNRFGCFVAILVPRKNRVLTSTLARSSYLPYKKESLEAFRRAFHGDFPGAMLLNSLIQGAALSYSMGPVATALEEGAFASGISGKGPAVAAICQTKKVLDRIKARWEQENHNSNVLFTRVIQPAQGESMVAK